MRQPLFKVIAVGDRHAKGRALEHAVGLMWSHLGYRDIRFNAHVIGEEIDVQGTHVISGEKLKGQCKAHANAVGASEVRLFYADVIKERAKNARLVGVFIALNGLTATSKSWHEDLSANDRDVFKILNGEDFVRHLSEAKVILQQDALLVSLRPKTSMPVVEAWLLVSDRGLFWLVVLDAPDRSNRYFAIQAADGSAVHQHDLEYLLTSIKPPADAFRISLGGRECLIKCLLNGEMQTLEQLAMAAQESVADTKCMVDSLISDGMLVKKLNHIYLRSEIDGAVSVARLCLGTAIELDFMQSDYFRKSLSSLLVPFVEAKYHVNFEADERDVVVKLLSISPSCLNLVCEGSSEAFVTSSSEFKRMRMADDEAVKWRRQLRQNLLHQFAVEYARDQTASKTTELLASNGIVLAKIKFDIGVACRDRVFLKLNVGLSFMVAEAGEAVSAGQFLSVTGPGPILTQGDALTNLGELDAAKKAYDQVIQNWPGTREAMAAAHNLGIHCMSRSEFIAAIKLFETLVDAENELKLSALANLAHCYAHLKDQKRADQALRLLKSHLDSDRFSSIHSQVEQILRS